MMWRAAMVAVALMVAGLGFVGRLLARDAASTQDVREHSVIIILNGTSLPSGAYEKYDTVTLEEQLQEALGELGECDGAEHGERSSRIFLYGSDGEAMFRAVKPTLLAYPLAATARVIIRSGPPGSPEREVRLP